MESKNDRTELTQVRWTPSERKLIDAAVAAQASPEERTISGLLRKAALARAHEVIAEAKAKALQRRQARARARIHVGKGGRK